MEKESNQLLGSWIIDQADVITLKQMGDVTIVFDTENKMRYIVKEKGSINITSLTYRIENDLIISVLPPGNQEERTRFVFKEENILILESKGLKSIFHRSKF